MPVCVPSGRDCCWPSVCLRAPTELFHTNGSSTSPRPPPTWLSLHGRRRLFVPVCLGSRRCCVQNEKIKLHGNVKKVTEEPIRRRRAFVPSSHTSTVILTYSRKKWTHLCHMCIDDGVNVDVRNLSSLVRVFWTLLQKRRRSPFLRSSLSGLLYLCSSSAAH